MNDNDLDLRMKTKMYYRNTVRAIYSKLDLEMKKLWKNEKSIRDR